MPTRFRLRLRARFLVGASDANLGGELRQTLAELAGRAALLSVDQGFEPDADQEGEPLGEAQTHGVLRKIDRVEDPPRGGQL